MNLKSTISDAHEMGLRSAIAKAPQYLLAKASFPLVWSSIDKLPRDQLKERGERQNGLFCFEEPEEVDVSAPDGPSHPEFLSKLNDVYSTEGQFVCEVGPAKLVGAQPLGVTPSGETIVETAEADESNLRHRVFDYLRTYGAISSYKAFQPYQSDHETDLGRVFPLVRYSGSTTTYYHWILGFGYKVKALERYRSVTKNDPTVLIEADPPTWVDESLRLLGCDPEDCVRWDRQTAYAESLVVPSHNIRSTANYNPSVRECDWIARRMRSNAGAKLGSEDERIYISRDDAPDRHVENRESVIEMLKQYGFGIYSLSDLSVSDQVRLFSRAEVIIGPHGAGFTNMIFSNKPTVIEFLPQSRIKPFYAALSSELGYDYKYMICPSDENHNLRVAIDRLQELIESVL